VTYEGLIFSYNGSSVSGNLDVGGLVGSNYDAVIDYSSIASAMRTSGFGGVAGGSGPVYSSIFATVIISPRNSDTAACSL
jgi:hypothetical protein